MFRFFKAIGRLFIRWAAQAKRISSYLSSSSAVIDTSVLCNEDTYLLDSPSSSSTGLDRARQTIRYPTANELETYRYSPIWTFGEEFLSSRAIDEKGSVLRRSSEQVKRKECVILWHFSSWRGATREKRIVCLLPMHMIWLCWWWKTHAHSGRKSRRFSLKRLVRTIEAFLFQVEFIIYSFSSLSLLTRQVDWTWPIVSHRERETEMLRFPFQFVDLSNISWITIRHRYHRIALKKARSLLTHHRTSPSIEIEAFHRRRLQPFSEFLDARRITKYLIIIRSKVLASLSLSPNQIQPRSHRDALSCF